ncbi:cytochrome c [Derxia lacustris]|uniref:cytochrome c n=1 Tax=Derxia lacustris TaxID=764842 RepID=UPI00111C0103|nr:cytochrome c [Derxia lacustris]
MRLRLAPTVLLLLLAACGKTPPEAPKAAAALEPVASIQELMQSLVDPSADALWESVSTTVSAAGTEEHQPRSDAEWLELRFLALRLAEAGNLLAVDGRPVAHAGKQLEDAHVSGILKPEEIQQRVDADRAAFASRAAALREAARITLAAIDEKNVDHFIEAGSRIDQACEACHKQYWYPNDRRPEQ